MELSKMFGVERGEIFRVNGFMLEFVVDYNTHNYEYLKCRVIGSTLFENIVSDALFRVISGAPDNIIHLPPPLTDEQRDQLKAIWTLGGRWLARDIYKDVRYFNEIPHKSKTSWQTGNDDEDAYYGYRLYNTLDICRLVSWSDLEPFDIGKAIEAKR